jgi:hypothetical protein
MILFFDRKCTFFHDTYSFSSTYLSVDLLLRKSKLKFLIELMYHEIFQLLNLKSHTMKGYFTQCHDV